MFLSQPISQRPALMPPPPSRQAFTTLSTCNTNNTTYNDNNKSINTNDNEETEQWAWKIEISLIPSLNMYYMLEPTSLTLRDMPMPLVQSRLSDYLRIQSIGYTFDSHSVRFECVTTNTLKFVIQFWRVGGGRNNAPHEDPERAVTMELQRRQGSVIEMQNVRRTMFHALLTGEATAATATPKHHQVPDIVMQQVDDAAYDHDEGRTDALEICLRLLESRCIDQMALGLESLKMLTEPTIVSQQDALIVGRAIVFQEGDYGARLQAALARYFLQEQQHNDEEEYNGIGHSIALVILANALQLVADSNNNNRAAAIDCNNSNFWKVVTADLLHNVEQAIQKPNQGALSAKCIRLLGGGAGRNDMMPDAGSLRSCLAQAHRYGKMCHLSLERESQKLLAMDTTDSNMLYAH